MRRRSALDTRSAALRLLAYCRANDWAGHDPYDALNSELFAIVPILDFKLMRMMATQALKRLPWNLRPLLRIQKTENPKALALFLQSLLKLTKLALIDRDDLVHVIAKK